MATRAVAMLPCITGAWKEIGGGLQLSTSGSFGLNGDFLKRPDLMHKALGREARTRALRDGRWWFYLDDGIYGSYSGQLFDHMRYPVAALRDSGERVPAVLAGPTCDSADVLYEKLPYPLPVTLEIGDKVLIEGTGAYTSTYSSVAFNGIPPLKTYHI